MLQMSFFFNFEDKIEIFEIDIKYFETVEYFLSK